MHENHLGGGTLHGDPEGCAPDDVPEGMGGCGARVANYPGGARS